MSLCPKANVLIGRNGAGKTTLVHAITKALSFVFSNDKSLGKDFLSSGNNTLNVRGYNTSDFHFDENKREYSHDVRIKAHGCLQEKLLVGNYINAILLVHPCIHHFTKMRLSSL